jgi:hypothetical protein
MRGAGDVSATERENFGWSKKLGFVLRLKKPSLHIGLTPGEKRPPTSDNIAPVRFSGELYHRQRLKPEFYYGLYRPG